MPLSSFITSSARLIFEIALWLYLVFSLVAGVSFAIEVIQNPSSSLNFPGLLLGLLLGFVAFIIGAAVMFAPLLVLFEINERVKNIEGAPEAA